MNVKDTDENSQLALAIMQALEEIRSELPQAWLGGRQRFLLFKSLRKHLALQFEAKPIPRQDKQ